MTVSELVAVDTSIVRVLATDRDEENVSTI